MLTGRSSMLAAFLVALAVIVAQIALARPDRLQPDEHTYLEVIDRLMTTGVYTDGTMTADGRAGKPGRFLAPAYPLLVAALAKVDPALRRTLACLTAKTSRAERNGCGSLWTLHAAQAVLAAASATAIFAIALLLSGSAVVAWVGLLLALATGELGGYARLILTDTVSIACFLMFLAALVALVASGRAVLAVAGGVALGVAALSRPGYLYLLYAAALTMAALALWPRAAGTRLRLVHAVLLLIAGLGVLAPWMLRNLTLFGDSAITAGYGAFTLVQRVAYNAMTWREWGAAWIFWLPDIGDDLARLLLAPDATHRLGFNAPDTFYKVGLGPLMTETLAKAGSAEAHQGYVIRQYVLGDLFKHVAVTFALAWRGLWAGKWLGVAAVVLAWPVVRELIRMGKVQPLLALVLPLAFMLGLHAFVSVNIVRYNVPLLALFCAVVAFALVDVGQRLTGRRLHDAGGGAA